MTSQTQASTSTAQRVVRPPLNAPLSLSNFPSYFSLTSPIDVYTFATTTSMIPPSGWISNVLLASTFSVGHNAAKNLVFRASSLLLRYSVLGFLSCIAYRRAAYTSFLMLLEDYIQKLYFIRSYGFREHAWIVIAFVVLFPAAGVYDTCLWMLDAPGYTFRPTITPARSFSRQLVPNPPYVLNFAGSSNGIDLDRTLSAGLYLDDITVIATHLPISQEIVAPPQKLSSEVQPRIWLDSEGWSVGFDLGWPVDHGGQGCVPNSTDTQQWWSCHFNNTSAEAIYRQSFGSPRIWWDNTGAQSTDISLQLQDDVWTSLTPNGSSAATKLLFTVTKAQRRHAFMQTAWKVTMQTAFPARFQSNEIVDFIRRGWNNDPDQVVDPEIQDVVDGVEAAQNRGGSYSAGVMIQEPQPFAIRATVIEFLSFVNSMNTSNDQFSSLRVRSINTTLLHSETLPSSDDLQPFASCLRPLANIVVGGQIHETTCDESISGAMNSSAAGSLEGQIDILLVANLSNIFGDGDTNTSQSAFDPHGQAWLRFNQAHLEELMTSRAFIARGDSDNDVTWQEPIAAISYLQIILVAIPALLAFLSWTLMAGGGTHHYKHSFLATVCATTHLSDNSCRRVGYLKDPPLIELRPARRHIVVGTPNGGTLANVEQDQVVAYSMVMEPLNLPVSMVSQGKGEEVQGS
ncbi:hypothetical protein NP233_g12983 [Leucocoprinus birnbaumii]|uniref:Transmembrane protein n=1 Tax=Leucocoprinus birnbaumii TaxID=56174 RepID=A0AAD5VDL7_9AGAR|nr:hypothetical protein NP233_g12983 [Leucocoprinus birnbaumii]